MRLDRKCFIVSSNCLIGVEAGMDGRIVYTTVETFGNDLKDCLINATIGREDWNGNECEARSIDDLTSEQYDIVERAISEELACMAEYNQDLREGR